MAWKNTETDEGQDIVYDGMEFGIAPSPTKGTANIQNANIATLSGEVLASYNRVAQQQTALTNQTLTPDGATLFDAPATLKAGTWIRVSASTVSSITAATSPSTASVNYLLVGGGAGGGSTGNGGMAGGGGAGRYFAGTISLAEGSYKVTIGLKGTGGPTGGNASSGSNGGDTIVDTIGTAEGGGGGGRGIIGISPASALNGSTGASGGGAGANSTNSGTGGSATNGNAGGNGFASGTASNRAAGGGGGSTSAGSAGVSSDGGDGGAGTSNSITGTAVVYSAGGGGGGGSTGGIGGSTGAGGNGGSNSFGSNATTPGSGGGGASSTGSTEYAGGDGADGIVVISYTTGSIVALGGTITYTSTNTVHTFTTDGTFTVVSVPTGGLYYVSYDLSNKVKLSSKFDPTGANALTHGTTGSITFSTVAVPNKGVAKAVEKYTNAATTEYKYYILDADSYVWVFDSSIYETYGTKWMLPDPSDYSLLRLTGLGALNGLLMAVGKQFIVGKPTNNLGTVFMSIDGGLLNEPFPTHNNFAMVGNQGKMYYCDGNYIGEVFPTTSLITSIANIQSQCSYTATTTTGTVSYVATGSLPYSPDGTRIPAVFYTDVYGTQPTNLAYNTVYYIDCDPENLSFQVYTTITGNSAIDIATGAAGNQFFTTFYPFGSGGANSTTPTVQISTQRVNLPANETAQTMTEIGNVVIIGGKSSTLYPWNQIDATPSDFIALPEADVKVMVNVNNMAYVFAGNKGNIYVTNGSVASLALKVPDYCAGVPGTPLTYIEPVFTWGDADYLRGRVYFSILDQTATKAGNCGGIWSFIPSQNVDPSQEVGMALRLENQQSYGDYDGYATIILPNQVQTVTSPQYWAAWQDSYSTGTSSFGIDYTGTVPVTTFVVETDLIPTGTLLSKDTYTQLEYKLSTPAQSGDSVQLYYRLDSTSAWTTCGTLHSEPEFPISGYAEMEFQKTQWLQLRAVMTTSGTTASSFCRLAQIILR